MGVSVHVWRLGGGGGEWHVEEGGNVTDGLLRRHRYRGSSSCHLSEKIRSFHSDLHSRLAPPLVGTAIRTDYCSDWHCSDRFIYIQQQVTEQSTGIQSQTTHMTQTIAKKTAKHSAEN